MGVSSTTVHRVISTYNRLGVAAVETPGTGGRRHQYLTLEQERALLQPYLARAAQGDVATAAEIQQALEAAVKQPVAETHALSPPRPPWVEADWGSFPSCANP